MLVFEGDGKVIPHSGGYSDYLGRRVKTEERQKAKAASKTVKTDHRNLEAKTAKLSFKDKHALATLPQEIADLEDAIEKAEAKLADPELFNKDPEMFNNLASSVTANKTVLAAKEDQWLELEALREEIEGA